MKRSEMIVWAAAMVIFPVLAFLSLAVADDSRAAKAAIVCVELPTDPGGEEGDDSLSFLKGSIPRSWSIRECSDKRAVLKGPRESLHLLEDAGLEIVKVVPERADSLLLRSEGEKGARPLSFSSIPPWMPLAFPGEVITAVVVNDIDDDSESEIVVGTDDGAGTGGNVYVYSWRGVLKGTWNAPLAGIHDVDNRDLDDDGTDELIVELDDRNSFYVLSHTASLEWSGTVTDAIAHIAYNDLNGDGDREVIVFSRNRDAERGQIIVFDPITHSPLGVRSYTSADLKDGRSPNWAHYKDLNGDGIKEIIPMPSYLNKKMEILAYDCSLLSTQYFSMHEDSWRTSYDFNGDGANDIAIQTSDETSVKLYGFIGFNGSSFSTTWTYPAGSGTIAKEDIDWDMTDSRIAFGTRDEDMFSGCQIYLLNAANGIETVPPVGVSGSVDDLKCMDLTSDGVEEVAILANAYSDPTHTWTFYVYDNNLNLLIPSGHYSFSEDTGSRYSSSNFGTNNMDGDSNRELIPWVRTGKKAFVVRYTGVLKWEYDAGEEVEDIDRQYDVDGDGDDDLVVTSGTAGLSWNIVTLKDQGSTYEVIGQRELPYEVYHVSEHDFDGDGLVEILPNRWSGVPERYMYSYDLSEQYWHVSSSGDNVEEINYYDDLDGNSIDDIVLASNDTSGINGYIYVFLGNMAGARRLAVIKRQMLYDYNLYCYNAPVTGDWTFWDTLSRNPSPLARDLWVIPSRNNTRIMTHIDSDGDGYGEIGVLKVHPPRHPRDQNLFLYNAPVDGDWTFWDARSRNLPLIARDFWMIPAGNTISLMADGGEYLAVMKNRRGDSNLYLYNAPKPGDWTFWDAISRNPSPVARDLWVIPYANDAVAMCGLDTTGDRKADSLLVVRDVAGKQIAYLWNIPVPGDWTYADALWRNLLPRAVDGWAITRRDSIDLVTGLGSEAGYDELGVLESYRGDYNLYIWNTPRPGDLTEGDALARNPLPRARDLWAIPAGNNAIGMSAF